MNLGRKQVVGMLAAVNVLGIIFAGNVMADMDKPNYAQLKLGAFEPTDDLDDAGFDTGFQISGAYGRYLTPYLIVEAGIDGFAMDNDVDGSNDTAGNFDQDNTLSVAGLLVTLKGEVPAGPAHVFGGVGAGFYTANLDSDIESTRLGDFSTDEDDQVFGLHVVAGVNYDVTSRFFAGIEGMYRWTDDLDIDDTVASIPVEYEGDLSGFSITVNGGFRF